MLFIHQSIPAAPPPPPPVPPPPPPGYCGAFTRLVSPGDEALKILCYPGTGHFPTPGPFPSWAQLQLTDA